MNRKPFPLYRPIFALPCVFALALMTTTQTESAEPAKSVHAFKAKSIDGEEIDLSTYKGKVLLIVNVASKCGYTDQYTNMVNAHESLKDKGLVVMGFPTNDFGSQEPGSNEEIKAFCEGTFDVDFPMFAKVSVKGDSQDPLFRYLTTAANPDKEGDISWNFEKFLIGKDGTVLRRFGSGTEPDSPEVIAAIEKALK